MQQERLCQCCERGTSVCGQDHDSFPPYLVEDGDRLEQITRTLRGKKVGWEIKDMKGKIKGALKQSCSLNTSIISKK